MSDPGREWTQDEIDHDMGLDDECGQCFGEGFIHSCFDGFCRDAEEGCDMCTRPCDWCNRPTPKQAAERAELGQILADALSKQNPKT